MSDNPALRALAKEHSWTYSESAALGVVLDANRRLPFLSIAAAEAAPHVLFHGHHPMCPYTIEGDWSVCDCGAAAEAAPLDVERLAGALHGHLFACGFTPLTETAHEEAHQTIAQAVAREYAALAATNREDDCEPYFDPEPVR